MENQTDLKWHQKPKSIIILLILFFPVGLYYMWKNNLWSKKTRWIVTAICSLILIGQLGGGSSSGPKAEEVLPNLLGSWTYRKEKVMGGMIIKSKYELKIIKEGEKYLYDCTSTTIDEYNGSIPHISNFNGSLGEVFKSGEFQGNSEFGIKLIGGEFGDDKCFIALGSSETQPIKNNMYINYPKGRGDQKSFKRD
jgi:hypothetical protein